MYFFHDSRRSDLRHPYGAAPAGSPLTISAEAALPQGSRVLLRLWQDQETLLPLRSEISSGGFVVYEVTWNRFELTERLAAEEGQPGTDAGTEPEAGQTADPAEESTQEDQTADG